MQLSVTYSIFNNVHVVIMGKYYLYKQQLKHLSPNSPAIKYIAIAIWYILKNVSITCYF